MRRHTGPGLPCRPACRRARVTGNISRVAAASQISSALRSSDSVIRAGAMRDVARARPVPRSTPRVVPGRMPSRIRRRADLAVDHHVHCRRRGFHQLAVAQQDCLGCVGVHRQLAQQHVGEQRHGLDVAARPAGVLAVTQATPFSSEAVQALRQRRAEGEHGARNVRQRRVVAAALRAARDLPVHVLIAAAVAARSACAMIACHSSRVCGSSMRISREAARQARRSARRSGTAGRRTRASLRRRRRRTGSRDRAARCALRRAAGTGR